MPIGTNNHAEQPEREQSSSRADVPPLQSAEAHSSAQELRKKELQLLTIDARIVSAIAPLMPDGARASASQSTEMADPPSPATTCSVTSFQLPKTFLDSKKGKEMLKAALFEEVFQDLCHTARVGEAPCGSQARVSNIAQLIAGKPLQSEHEVRSSVASVFGAHKEVLAHRLKAATKTLAHVDTLANFSLNRHAVNTTRDCLDALVQLRALAWLNPDDLPHSLFCERGQQPLKALSELLEIFGNDCLAQSDEAGFKTTLTLLGDLQAVLSRGRLDRVAPEYLLPAPKESKPAPTSGPVGLRALLKGPKISSGLAQFAPGLRSDVGRRIAALQDADTLLKDASAWRTTDDAPPLVILEGFIDVVRVAAQDLVDLKSNVSAVFPAGLTSFISLVARLRFHGGPEGLPAFSTVIGGREDEKTLREQPEICALRNSGGLVRAVKSVAAWRHLNSADRAELLKYQHSFLSDMVGRATWIFSATFSEKTGEILTIVDTVGAYNVEGLSHDIEELRESAKLINPHVGLPALAECLGAPTYAMCDSVQRAIAALTLPGDTAEELLVKVRNLPTTFGDSPLELALKGYSDRVRIAAQEATAAASHSHLEKMRTAFYDGSDDIIISSWEGILRLAAASEPQSEVRTSILGEVDNLMLNYMNELRTMFRSEADSLTSTLKTVGHSATELAQAMEGLRRQLLFLARTKKIALAHIDLVGWARVNHSNESVVTLANALPPLTLALITELRHEIEVAECPDSLRIANLLSSTPGAFLKLRRGSPAEVAALEKLVAAHGSD